MSKIEELESILQSLQALKAPGASKSKIAAVTAICIENIQLDSTIAQKLYSHFKRSPATHKLGILFVVDSVTRQWIEKAKSAGQEIGGTSAPNGTFASGVQRITELMPSLLDDMARLAPEDQKVKVKNLVDIWERSNTFPAAMLADYRRKASGNNNPIPSKTPPGSPPAQLLQALGLSRTVSHQPSAPPVAASMPTQINPQDAAGLLAALSNLSNAQQAPSVAAPLPQAPAAPDFGALLAGLAQPASVPPAPPSFQAPPQIPPQYQPFAPSQPPATQSQPHLYPGTAAPPVPMPLVQLPAPQAQDPLAQLVALIPPHMLDNQEQVAQVLSLFNDLAKANVPQEQWGPVVAALNAPEPSNAPPAAASWQPEHNGRSNGYGHEAISRKRERSRSPDYRRERNGNIQRRPSPVYGNYDASAKMVRNDSNDARQYRQRSPLSRSNGITSPPPNAQAGGPKWVSYDASIPRDHIKVLSRTLFVGGCTTTEPELRAIFTRFGEVQTCICNMDKRHAFVKMCTRQGALAAKAGMEALAETDPIVAAKARQTKWGVGFGPRECCNYGTGESIVPISSLTEADFKWALSAEYGGTGGREVVSGMVMEEPDIEIGAGVSSKAMSKRVGPDTGRQNNKGSGRNDGGNRNRGRRDGGGGRGQQGHGQGQNDGAFGGNAVGGANYGQIQSMPAQGQGYGYGQQVQQAPPPQPKPQPQVAYVQPPPVVPSFGFQFAMPR